ncbi:MAG: cytochrome c oxidase subunit II [Thermoplasmata archaeon]|uniref:Cytochrome c oxidase subunit II n=1 Tax=Candidatus Sysuiplasma superficiale TaxID=2823368 RepID=A0A8J7YY41_9ARCH|nr:cytochrome c oxidase subunit II [Candidatus Sysuiplasma superficiale]
MESESVIFGQILISAATSVTSKVWWSVFDLYLTVAIIASAFFIIWIIYLVVSTRERPGRHTPSQIHPGIIPSANRGRPRNVAFLVVFLVIVFFGLWIYQLPTTNYIKQAPQNAKNELVIDVYASQWIWTFKYPNGYNVTRYATFPTNTTILFRVTSLDVMHEFSVPAFKIKIDAFPGVWNVAWTEVLQSGNYTAFCTELCGLGHATMWAKLNFVSPAQYQAWIASHN